jgi:formamidopyrimidine-DNA glycosylase
MPELPEVETVCRTLRPLVGRPLGAMRVTRPDVVRDPIGVAARLAGQRLVAVRRLGKQIALVFAHGPAICIHLGMSGSLCVREHGHEPEDHVHVAWMLGGGRSLRFRDPRRFGGVWVFADEAQLESRRWRRLGPDALAITPGQLHAGLSRTRRELKAALLDQTLVAGLGNIYVDELLYAVGLHPRMVAVAVDRAESVKLVRAMRRLLGRAIEAGGSTLRDYVDAEGRAGGFQRRFRVYGRFGEPCRGCGRVLDRLVVAGRTTTACGRCQSGAAVVLP